MNQNWRIIRGWGLGTACAGFAMSLALRPAVADYFERMPAAVCRPETPKNFANHYVITTTATMLESVSGSSTEFACKIPDKSNLPATSITSIKVAVRDNHTTLDVTIKACAFVAATGNGGACGTQQPTTGTGYSEPELSTAGELAQLDVGETPYVLVLLPGSQSGNYSAIAGLYFYSSTM
jgi:hypothetical protein